MNKKIIDNQEHIRIFYAVQTCDSKSYQNPKRYCSDSKTEVSKKCVTSFLQSVKYCADLAPNTEHNIIIIDDESTEELVDYLNKLVKKFSAEHIKINLVKLPKEYSGIAGSIKYCYEWMQNTSTENKDLVYQIQDDYMFDERAIYEIISIWFQMYQETGTHAIVTPFNMSFMWLTHYRNWASPRTVIVGEWRYWIQIYDCTCSWLTSREQFTQHWSLYYEFFRRIPLPDSVDFLENKSLNYMFTQRKVLGLTPVQSLAWHMQTEADKDPHVDWRPLWNSIDINI